MSETYLKTLSLIHWKVNSVDIFKELFAERKNSNFKGPEMVVSLICSNTREDSTSGVECSIDRVVGDDFGKVTIMRQQHYSIKSKKNLLINTVPGMKHFPCIFSCCQGKSLM